MIVLFILFAIIAVVFTIFIVLVRRDQAYLRRGREISVEFETLKIEGERLRSRMSAVRTAEEFAALGRELSAWTARTYQVQERACAWREERA